MSYLNNEQKMNEIIFANRNKAYGAYAIRSAYTSSILKSLSIVAGSTALLGIAVFLLKEPATVISDEVLVFQDSIHVIQVNNIVEIPEEKTKPAVEQVAKVENISEQNLTKIVDSLVTTSETTTNATSSPATGVTSASLNGSAGTGSVAETGPGEKITSPEISSDYMVDRLPEFEGGMKELYAFISKNLRYPVEASTAGVSAKVHLKFVVDEEGKVSMVTALNKPGYGLEEEAIRVIKLLPRFKTPALVGGRPVKVYYQLPINFKTF